MFDNLIVFLGEKFGGAWITKGVGMLGVYLMAHHILPDSAVAPWVQNTTGALLALLSGLLTWWRARRHNQVVAIASTNQRPEGLPLVQPSVTGLAASETPTVTTTPTFNGPSRVTF